MELQKNHRRYFIIPNGMGFFYIFIDIFIKKIELLALSQVFTKDFFKGLQIIIKIAIIIKVSKRKNTP